MATIREDFYKKVNEAKEKNGNLWYRLLDNFALSIAGFDSRKFYTEDEPELLKEPLKGYETELARSKTLGQLFNDIDNAFNEAGTFEKMIEKCTMVEKMRGSYGEDYHNAECELAETCIEPLIKLIEMGYSFEELS